MELKKCPFCGGEAKIEVGDWFEWRVWCSSCRCEMARDTDEDAITAWNRREGVEP